MDRAIGLTENDIEHLLYALRNLGDTDSKIYKVLNNATSKDKEYNIYYRDKFLNHVIEIGADNGICGTPVRMILDLIQLINPDLTSYIKKIKYKEDVLTIYTDPLINNSVYTHINDDILITVVRNILQTDNVILVVEMVRE